MEIIEDPNKNRSKYRCDNGHEFWHDHYLHFRLHERRPATAPLPPPKCYFCKRDGQVREFVAQKQLVTSITASA